MSVESAVICLLFAGMLLYLCAPLMRIASAPQIAAAEEYARQREFTVYGIIIREETVLPAHPIGAAYAAADGQAVAAGSTIAVLGEERLSAPTAGIYVRKTDGFEHLTADMLTEITPAGIDRLLQSSSADMPNGGKIIEGRGWLLAATVQEACTEMLQKGQAVTLTAQTEGHFPVTATVIHISDAENGRCAVVFRCIDRLQHTLHLRQLSVSLSDTPVEGLRVPTQAIHTDEAGSFVYTLSASKAEKIYVTIVSENGDFTILEKGSSANALHAGDTIISAPDFD